MEKFLMLRLSVEQMKHQLQIAYNLHCDEMKSYFKETIEKETEAFLKYGLASMIQDEAKLLVRDELRSQVREYIRSNKSIILGEVREEMERKAKTEMKNMVFDILGDLKKQRQEDDD